MAKKISDIPKADRPREKLLQKGAAALSDLELMAILLGSGTKNHNVLTVAGWILKAIDTAGINPGIEDLMAIEGVGPAKAALIAAALEFSRRRIRPEGFKIMFPPDALPLVRHLADRKQEHFICISLNGAREVIAVRTVSVGLVDKSPVHPREVFADPITDRASAIILAHNHPAGTLSPSKADIETTRRLKDAGELMGICVLDHIIFNHNGYYSFLEHGDI